MQTQMGPKRPRHGLGPEFLKLWAASAVSNVGDGVTVVAAPLLAASLTRDPLLVAGLAFAVQLPWLLFSLVSGAIVDRLDRRIVMGAVAAFRSALIGVLGLAVLADAASIPLLYCVFFLLGAAETVFDPASVTVLPTIVSREGLPKANARLAGTSTVLNVFVGPPLGGFLFAAAAALPFLLAGASFAAACALVLALRGTFRVERREPAPPTRLRGEIAEGVRWLARHRLLRSMAMALGLMNLTMAAWNSILVLFATERLGLGPRGFGLLLSAYALGGTAASAVAHQIITRLGPGRTLRIGLLIEAGTAM
ncbi:MAG: MFS transporter, partial [Chloroflexia bacterium]|nr:MFS transporter [Chloroflexia bacterium]